MSLTHSSKDETPHPVLQLEFPFGLMLAIGLGGHRLFETVFGWGIDAA